MRPHQPSGLRQGLPLRIDPNWSPDQAMAVIEMLEDLHACVWAHYQSVLFDKFRNDRLSHDEVKVTDPPF